jgi:hypothetical protein
MSREPCLPRGLPSQEQPAQVAQPSVDIEEKVIDT